MAESVLERIAARLGRSLLPEAERESRFAQLKRNAEPPVPPAMTAEPLAYFKSQAIKNLFEVAEVTDLHAAIATLQATLQTPLPLALSPQPGVQALPWQAHGFALANDVVAPALGVIEASAAIAETGTVVISSSEAPSRLLFLAEELLVILRTENVVALQDDLWQNLDPGGQRVLHLISGPSRTGDVEQTLQVGAHGPKRVYLWLL